MNNVFQPGFGLQLKAAREAQGLAIGDVAAKLKLTTRQIENLETENFTQLPGEIFVRGFVRNYARLVGMDPEQLLMPVEAAKTVAETITAPSEGLTFSSPRVKRWILLPAISGLLFLILVAILYHWLREGEEALVVEPASVQPVEVQPVPLPVPDPAATTPPTGTDPAAAPAAPGATAPAAPSATAPVLPASTTPATTPLVTPVPPHQTATAPVPVAPPVTKPTAPAPAATPPKPAPAPTPAPPALAKPLVETEKPSSNLRFSAQADAWIQVSDSKGKRFSKLVKAGSVEIFAGTPPYNLVVGEAAQVRMSYKGQNVDLKPFIDVKVARLTLE